jgi:hypothetical protein
MKTYLSIDLDYWLHNGNNYHVIPRQMFRLFKSLSSMNKVIVKDHEQLLPFIEKLNVERIIHIDYHQDIAYPYWEDDSVELNCGTFWYFLQNRKNINFHWIYPRNVCKTDNGGICMNMGISNPLKKKNWIFRKQTTRKGLSGYTKFGDMNIVGIGVSVSRNYCYTAPSNLDEIVDFLIKLGYHDHNYYQPTNKELEVQYASECTV